MLIGLQALDYVPKAAGTAAGLTGLFGYLFGAVMANIVLGAVVDKLTGCRFYFINSNQVCLQC